MFKPTIHNSQNSISTKALLIALHTSSIFVLETTELNEALETLMLNLSFKE